MRILNKSSDANKIQKQNRIKNSTGLETFLEIIYSWIAQKKSWGFGGVFPLHLLEQTIAGSIPSKTQISKFF